MFPGRDGTLRVLRHTVTCFRMGCAQDPGTEQCKVTGQDTGQVGSLKNRWDQGSGAWAPPALCHSPAVCPGVTLPLWGFTLSAPGRQEMPETHVWRGTLGPDLSLPQSHALCPRALTCFPQGCGKYLPHPLTLGLSCDLHWPTK